MNEHNATGNEQAVSPAILPMKNNTLGTAAPMINKKPGMAGPTAPVQTEIMPAHKNPLQPEYYQPGGHMADQAQPIQQTGYNMAAMPQTGMVPNMSPKRSMYPSLMPQMGMVPSDMPQAGMEAPYAAMPGATPQRSIFQPAAQQGQGMMPMNGSQRTSIMTSGMGVRNSVLTGTDFTQGFLQTQIGRHVKIEFVLGTNMLIDREGDLVKVGTDYLIIQETETDDYLLCDIYSIKFIRFYY